MHALIEGAEMSKTGTADKMAMIPCATSYLITLSYYKSINKYSLELSVAIP